VRVGLARSARPRSHSPVIPVSAATDRGALLP
jgi:hypothetical protein